MQSNGNVPAVENTRPLGLVSNIFKAYVNSLVKSAGPHVRLTCADGTPFPEPLGLVLRRAAWDFGKAVEVISGYRSLAHNRAVYGNRRKVDGRYVGEARDLDGYPTYLWLADGEHRLQVWKGGFKLFDDSIDVRRGMRSEIKLKLEPGESSPPGPKPGDKQEKSDKPKSDKPKDDKPKDDKPADEKPKIDLERSGE